MAQSNDQGSDQDSRAGRAQNSGQGNQAAGWIAALVGIWVLITPFFWGTATGSGAWGGGGAWLYWSNVISGIVIAILAGYSARSGNSGAGWLAALVGIWVLITPFFWGAMSGAGLAWWGGGGAWLYWSNVISGIVVAILAGYSVGSGSSQTDESTTA
jgi:hypothetical protein